MFVEYRQKIKEGYVDYDDVFISMAKDSFSTRNIEQSLPIAIAITAYSRIYINMIIKYLEYNGVDIYYTDTDSLWLCGNLPYNLVGNLLGQFKLEFNAKLAYFPLPKVYYCIGNSASDLHTNNCTELKKSKGLKSGSLTKEQYINLYSGISIKKDDIRFIRNFNNQTISYSIKEIKISPINTKRISIYKNGEIIDTKPLLVIDNVVKSSYTLELNKNMSLIPYTRNLKNKSIKIKKKVKIFNFYSMFRKLYLNSDYYFKKIIFSYTLYNKKGLTNLIIDHFENTFFKNKKIFIKIILKLIIRLSIFIFKNVFSFLLLLYTLLISPITINNLTSRQDLNTVDERDNYLKRNVIKKHIINMFKDNYYKPLYMNKHIYNSYKLLESSKETVQLNLSNESELMGRIKDNINCWRKYELGEKLDKINLDNLDNLDEVINHLELNTRILQLEINGIIMSITDCLAVFHCLPS